MTYADPRGPREGRLGRGAAGVVSALVACAELVLPASCGACGRPGTSWCLACAADARARCFAGGPRAVWPTPCPDGMPSTWSVTPYDGAVRSALVAYKDEDRRDLVRVLAPLLASALSLALAGVPGDGVPGRGAVLVVPVPSSPAAVRRRGDSPMLSLTRAAVALLDRGSDGPELRVVQGLRLRRRVADQAGLDHRQRAANLEHAFRARRRWVPELAGATCLLTDDVLTTGATLVEAARALRAAGAADVTAVTVAATQRRGIPVLGAT